MAHPKVKPKLGERKVNRGKRKGGPEEKQVKKPKAISDPSALSPNAGEVTPERIHHQPIVGVSGLGNVRKHVPSVTTKPASEPGHVKAVTRSARRRSSPPHATPSSSDVDSEGYIPYGLRDGDISSDDEDDWWGPETHCENDSGRFACCWEEHYSCFGSRQCCCCDGPWRNCSAEPEDLTAEEVEGAIKSIEGSGPETEKAFNVKPGVEADSEARSDEEEDDADHEDDEEGDEEYKPGRVVKHRKAGKALKAV